MQGIDVRCSNHDDDSRKGDYGASWTTPITFWFKGKFVFIEHVNLSVSNLQRSIDFYCKLFDFRVRWRGEADVEAQEAHVGNDEMYIALFETQRPGNAEVDYQRVGLNHFGVVVADLKRYRDKLHQLGIAPHYEPEYAPGRRFYFYDPDTVEAELVQYDQAD